MTKSGGEVKTKNYKYCLEHIRHLDKEKNCFVNMAISKEN